MSELLDRVSALIPGLVQAGSLTDYGRVDRVHGVVDGVLSIMSTRGQAYVESLVLTDRTSRVHAVWWINATCVDLVISPWKLFKDDPKKLHEVATAMRLAAFGEEMTGEQVDALASFVIVLHKHQEARNGEAPSPSS